MRLQNAAIQKWVDEIQRMTTPAKVVFCDGSQGEKDQLIRECLATGELIELNQSKLPGCYLHRSAPHDVARTEHLTFVCTEEKDDAGPNNNWMAPDEARRKLAGLYKGAMKGRTMYVVPFLMGPPGSRFSKVGVEITDSKYVVLNMRIMTRIGQVALEHLGDSDDFAWIRPGADGRLWALNPESGFFGVVPGTSHKTNPNAMEMIQKDTIYTNVALRPDGTPWWEGHDDPPPESALDWQGRPWTPKSTEKAAHPNSRFTTPAAQCPSIAPNWEDPEGVPISAILFGARRQRN